MQPAWPYLTTDIPGIPAVIRRLVEDFQVDELPAYDPCGTGGHVYVRIEKVGITTRAATLEMAGALGVQPSKIGAAGRKDARGITRQVLSVEGVEPSRLRSLTLPGIRVIDVARHHSKLRPGLLRGNRFTVRLREIPRERSAEVQSILDRLAQRGVPNYFGPQRFGTRGDTWEVGRALLAGDFPAAVMLIVGQPSACDHPPVRRARELAAEGKYREAAEAWPKGFTDCARLCRLLERTQGDAREAIFALDRSVLGFYVSAYQGWLFNRVVAARLPDLDRLLPGDITFSHRTGLCSRFSALATEQVRADRFVISPTGPIVGFAMIAPQEEAGSLEERILREAGCTPDAVPRAGPLRCVGGRRPLRFPLAEVDVASAADASGPFVELRFTLPPGCYATAVLREICKDQLREGVAGLAEA